jgi:hypothetical protein
MLKKILAACLVTSLFVNYTGYFVMKNLNETLADTSDNLAICQIQVESEKKSTRMVLGTAVRWLGEKQALEAQLANK